MKHVTASAGKRFSCILDVIDLNFVYGSGKSYEKFVQEFARVKLNQYTLCKEGDIYYLAKPLSSRERKESGCFLRPTPKTSKPKTEDLTESPSVEEQSGNPVDNVEVASRHSDSSSLNGSELGTDGGKNGGL